MRIATVILLSVLLSLLSCSSQKESGPKGLITENSGQQGQPAGSGSVTPDGKVAYALKITPERATRDSTLLAALQGGVTDSGIEWLVNGSASSNPKQVQFKATGTRKGDKVQARTMIHGREVLSNVVEIRNSPPLITDARIVSEPGQGGVLRAEVSTSDSDGDSVTLGYEWTRNGEQAGSSQRLTGQFKRGDKISVRITPFDGEEYGNAVVLQREIANVPPVVADDGRVSFDGRLYTHQIRAVDPDGDSLTYTLRSGPPGMTVDGSKGLVQWDVPKDFVGKAPVTVVISDGHGGDTVFPFNAVIRLESKAKN